MILSLNVPFEWLSSFANTISMIYSSFPRWCLFNALKCDCNPLLEEPPYYSLVLFG